MCVPLKEELSGGEDTATVRPADIQYNHLGVAENVRFTASVKWSGRGRNGATSSDVPYVAIDASGTSIPDGTEKTPRRRRSARSQTVVAEEESDADSSLSDVVPSFDYIDVDVSSGLSRDFLKYIGREFDVSQDGGTFRIQNNWNLRDASYWC
jgi:hypothetical protein